MNINTDETAINTLLTRGVENIYPSFDYLEARLNDGKQLTLYLGIDPTGPDLHLGHAIPLRKMAEFQKLGHKLILLIGDFTGMIGDPTDKSATRVRLTREQVLENASKYKAQASKIISFEGENAAELKYNSEWLAKLGFSEIVELASNFTVQQMLERDMFEKRIAEGKPVHLHEFLYPLMQAYDSVAMDVDGEIGGNDQTFNMLAGRDLMKSLKGKEKFVITSKLLTDPTGKKMGKSEGNMITLVDSADDMFGKVMSWTDGMIIPGFEILTDLPNGEIKEMKIAMGDGVNPRDFKVKLAAEVVATFFDRTEGDAAVDRFNKLFQEHAVPEDVPEVKLDGAMSIVDALVATKLAQSKGDARRLIDGGGVKVNEEVVTGYDFVVDPAQTPLLQKGKRHFVKIIS
ncbi:MAG: tyrosine--tRNA ligase [Candidatus Uhrbacteria bacterium]|nr:tyrosine--tRNA ligase [Candidatus Uhrbacteria bacterium]